MHYTTPPYHSPMHHTAEPPSLTNAEVGATAGVDVSDMPSASTTSFRQVQLATTDPLYWDTHYGN